MRPDRDRAADERPRDDRGHDANGRGLERYACPCLTAVPNRSQPCIPTDGAYLKERRYRTSAEWRRPSGEVGSTGMVRCVTRTLLDAQCRPPRDAERDHDRRRDREPARRPDDRDRRDRDYGGRGGSYGRDLDRRDDPRDRCLSSTWPPQPCAAACVHIGTSVIVMLPACMSCIQVSSPGRTRSVEARKCQYLPNSIWPDRHQVGSVPHAL